jgi:Uma2 family endonuclease
MVAHPEPATMTVEEYLALEEASQVKHEYVRGHVYAMSGGTIAHDLIANDVRAVIGAHLGEGPCMVLGPDVRLRVSEVIYYYPDAMVTCDDSPDLGALEVQTPRLVVEVLSDATEANDRGGKFANYQTLDSFEEYLLVDSRRRAVERYRRAEHGRWIYQRYGPDASVTLETIGLTCSVATFYRRTPLLPL